MTIATETTSLAPEEAIAPSTKVTATRIGFLSDDHNTRDDGGDLPAEVLAAFRSAGCDLIVHLGHMGVRDDTLGRGVLDRLATVAPVLAVRDYSGKKAGGSYITPAQGERVRGLARVIEAGGFRIGAIHNLEKEPGPAISTPAAGLPSLSGLDLDAVLRAKFGGPVDIVAFASTHREAAILKDGVLFVNPGSPTFPKGRAARVAGQRALGTVGVLDVADGTAVFEVIHLAEIANAPAGTPAGTPAQTPSKM
jgi:predicted phosphodiesterase